jgi:hypothetical protein
LKYDEGGTRKLTPIATVHEKRLLAVNFHRRGDLSNINSMAGEEILKLLCCSLVIEG